MKISPRKYAQALAQTLEASQDPKLIMRNFLLLLRKRKQSKLLSKILLAFEEEWNARRGVLKLKVQYPDKFEKSLPELEENLTKALGKSIEITASSAPGLLGGFRLQTGDTLIDASLQARLKALSHRLNN